MYNIDGKDHNLKMKSSRTNLTNHTRFISCHWLLIPSGGEHTETRRMPDLKILLVYMVTIDDHYCTTSV